MAVAVCDGRPLSPDDHSELEPPLPIPNRTVKRLSADDSEHFARESRTSSGNSQRKRESQSGLPFFISCQTVFGQYADTPILKPVALSTALRVFILGFPRAESVRYRVSRDRWARSATSAMPPRASTTFLLSLIHI